MATATTRTIAVPAPALAALLQALETFARDVLAINREQEQAAQPTKPRRRKGRG